MSHIESVRHPPSEDFAKRAEQVLSTGQALWRRWCEFDAARRSLRPKGGARPSGEAEQPSTAADLIVEHDDARLRYRDGAYQLTMRRLLTNVGAAPITRFLMRISVDRHPDDPERSNSCTASIR